MCNDVVISVEKLGKKYIIGHQNQRERYVTLRDVVSQGARNLLSSVADLARGKPIVIGDTTEEFWALRDVTFEVKSGEVVGVIGRNGAGKSTLLKVLSRITEPSEGRVRIKGRVASLLEVGTGFHPELTGRENVYLNGAILGMRRAEIKAKFDEIVAFADVENFLDTPVKRYSSGMYVRLAFAVAAHLEPEILVVDEVLSVGDAEFQRKCLGKISEVAKGGRTILFVSHNMGSIAALCEKAVLLQRGRIEAAGRTASVIESYCNVSKHVLRVEFPIRAGNPSITAISLDEEALRRGEFSASIEFFSPFFLRRPVGGLVISSLSGVPIWGTNGRFHPSSVGEAPVDCGVLTCKSPSIPLASSTYNVSAWLSDWHQDFDEKINALSFEFRIDADVSQQPNRNVIGHMEWPASWSLNRLADIDDPPNPVGQTDFGNNVKL